MASTCRASPERRRSRHPAQCSRCPKACSTSPCIYTTQPSSAHTNRQQHTKHRTQRSKKRPTVRPCPNRGTRSQNNGYAFVFVFHSSDLRDKRNFSRHASRTNATQFSTIHKRQQTLNQESKFTHKSISSSSLGISTVRPFPFSTAKNTKH